MSVSIGGGRTVVTKVADSKGRITLGEKFANGMVIVEEIDDTAVRLTLARAVPECEVWLYDNPKALASVRQGLTHGGKRQFTKAPDMVRARKLAHRIPGDAE